jgi:DNA-directed RNA polymerase subunit RPC12/RpoP
MLLRRPEAIRAVTFEIACMVCGAALYSGFDLKSPNDVLKTAGYRCKKCGAKLSIDKFHVEIKKLDGSFS